MQRSTVKWFDAKKGYGFIDHPEGGDDVFVHYSQIISEKDFKTLRTGQEVAFDMNDGPKGLHALEVKPVEEHGELAEENDLAEEDEASTTPLTSEQAPASEPSEPAQAEPSQTEPQQSEPQQSEPQHEDREDRWDDWDEEEWTDEHGNPPDPMAGPSF